MEQGYSSQRPDTMTKGTASHKGDTPEILFRPKGTPEDTARSLFLEGKQFQKEKQYVKALERFRDLLEKDHTHVLALLETAKVYEIMADKTANPKKKHMFYTKALSFLEIAHRFQRQKPEKMSSSAKNDLLGIIKYHQGQILAKCGDFHKAGPVLDQALYSAPFLLEAWDARGVTFLHLDEPKEAHNCFSAALSVNDKHVPAMIYGYLLEKNDYFSFNCDENFLANFFSQAQRTMRILRKGVPKPERGLSEIRKAELSGKLYEFSHTYPLQPNYQKALSSLITWLS